MWKPKKKRMLTIMVRAKSQLDIVAAEEGWTWYKGDIDVDEQNPLYILLPRKLGYIESLKRCIKLWKYGVHCCVLYVNS